MTISKAFHVRNVDVIVTLLASIEVGFHKYGLESVFCKKLHVWEQERPVHTVDTCRSLAYCHLVESKSHTSYQAG